MAKYESYKKLSSNMQSELVQKQEEIHILQEKCTKAEQRVQDLEQEKEETTKTFEASLAKGISDAIFVTNSTNANLYKKLQNNRQIEFDKETGALKKEYDEKILKMQGDNKEEKEKHRQEKELSAVNFTNYVESRMKEEKHKWIQDESLLSMKIRNLNSSLRSITNERDSLKDRFALLSADNKKNMESIVEKDKFLWQWQYWKHQLDNKYNVNFNQ